MELGQIKWSLTELHKDAGQLLTDLLHLRPTLKLVLWRLPLRDLENRLDEYLRRFVELDGELIKHANPPSDVNTALRNAAQFNFYAAVRDSVRGLLLDSGNVAGSLRNQLDFLGSLALSVVALLVAVISLVLQFGGR